MLLFCLYHAYLVSPESAATTAIVGTFASAEEILGSDLSILTEVKEPDKFPVDDAMIIEPLPEEEERRLKLCADRTSSRFRFRMRRSSIYRHRSV
ncbi:MAG: hypothetical protein KHY39_01600 [Clostridiaceae bacterium]|nr:hypothetical protein [Clostridiaceae bacterium]